MSYATIPIFFGETKILYWENMLAYALSDINKPKIHPLYTKNYMGCGVLALREEEGLFLVIEDALGDEGN